MGIYNSVCVALALVGFKVVVVGCKLCFGLVLLVLLLLYHCT